LYLNNFYFLEEILIKEAKKKKTEAPSFSFNKIFDFSTCSSMFTESVYGSNTNYPKFHKPINPGTIQKNLIEKNTKQTPNQIQAKLINAVKYFQT
jgi:hypothetical protein